MSPDFIWFAALWISASVAAWAIYNPIPATALVAAIAILLTTAID